MPLPIDPVMLQKLHAQHTHSGEFWALMLIVGMVLFFFWGMVSTYFTLRTKKREKAAAAAAKALKLVQAHPADTDKGQKTPSGEPRPSDIPWKARQALEPKKREAQLPPIKKA